MIQQVWAKLKTGGIGGLLQNLYYRLLPRRLDYYSNCKLIFQAGVGLEIGGPSGIFRRGGIIPVYSVATKIDNVNFAPNTLWESAIREGNSFNFNKDITPGRQYIGEATRLDFIENSSYDFVLSSHCIEHLANPIKGLLEWIRVLKPDGLLILVLPHKDGTFDHRRPVTSFKHLIEDFENQVNEDDMTHLEEILRLHDLAKDPGAHGFVAFQERAKRNQQNRSLHHHVFDTRLAVEAINYIGLQILSVEVFLPYHIIIIARKVSQENIVDNEKYRGGHIAPCWRSPFPSDRKNY